jgi:multiple antibiotic resistance protein
MTILSAAVLLFLVMDPLGNIPMFLVALAVVEPRRQRSVLVRELLIALGVLLVFLFGGRYLLEVFSISQPSINIAGGVILFLIAIRMIFPAGEGVFAEAQEGEPLVVPLAIPYLAGPSAMAVVMLLATREPERWMDWLIALAAAWSASAVILVFAANLSSLLGKRGLTALQRLMGMLLTAVAVQMALTGVREFLVRGGA